MRAAEKSLWLTLLVGLLCPVGFVAQADEPQEAKAQQDEKPNFIRVQRDDRGRPLSMDTAVVRYTPAQAGQAVDPQVRRVGTDGRTPLHLAAEGGHLDTVRELLERGADPTAEDKQGLSPLHLAAKGGHTDVVKLLLENRPAADAAPNVTVDLIGVVHIGEKDYYEALDKSFADYDAVLYELVAPKGTRIPKDAAERTPGSAVGMLQAGMKDMLELAFQLHHIDYHRENFVHADMTPEEFAKAMEERGESFLKMALQSIGHSLAEQSKPGGTSDLDLMAAMFSRNRPLALKRVMAGQFEDLESQMKMFGGPQGSAIIHARNQKALEVLREQIDAGKVKIGIFYGAGHMPDFHDHLVDEFGLKPGETTWLTAWDLQSP